MKTEGQKVIAKNSKASYNYFLSDFTECGIELVGTEIKALRVHGASLNDSYIIIRNNELINNAIFNILILASLFSIFSDLGRP